jgi:major vault protein
VGIWSFILAEENEYVIITNPIKKTSDGDDQAKMQLQKFKNGQNDAVQLDHGKRLVIPGPVSFPLWPGQTHKVIKGHRLRDDQYLVIKAYEQVLGEKGEEGETPSVLHQVNEERIIRGTDTQFFIPENGWEVLQVKREYVQDAVKLEEGEFCELQKSDGSRRLEKGPNLVFPEVGELFVNVAGQVVRKALRLQEDEYCELEKQDGTRRMEQGPNLVFPEVGETFVEVAGDVERKALKLMEDEYCELESQKGKRRLEKGPALVFPQVGEVFVEVEDRTLRDNIRSKSMDAAYMEEMEMRVARRPSEVTQKAVKLVEGEYCELEKPDGERRLMEGPALVFPEVGEIFVRDKESGEVVRSAPKLRAGQYCILLQPDGNRRYVRGPSVAFPKVGEKFIREHGSRHYDAEQLKPEMGLHVKVVKDFSINAGDDLESLIGTGSFRLGQDLFIEGKDGLFFTSENLEVVARVSPIFLSENEGLYVRDLSTGTIKTVPGPKTYLPNPIKEAIVHRHLSDEKAKLYHVLPSDPNKAIAINIPPNHAIMVSSKDKRHVVKGPQVYILDFHEELEVLRLSTDTPKTDKVKMPVTCLQVNGNVVSDKVSLETKDHVRMEATVSYRISFKGEDELWFNVNNYVGLLCDHLRSIVRAVVRSVQVEQFNNNSTEIIRSSVLGKSEEGGRKGKTFEENGMHVYDLEVLNVRVLDSDVASLLANSQREAIQTELNRVSKERRHQFTELEQSLAQKELELKVATLVKELEHFQAEEQLEKSRIALEVGSEREREVGHANTQAEAKKILADQELSAAKARVEMAIQEVTAAAAAFEKKMGSISPKLAEALITNGEQQLLGDALREIVPISVVEKEPVESILRRFLGALPFSGGSNGHKSILGLSQPVVSATPAPTDEE